MRLLEELPLAFGCALLVLLCGCANTSTTKRASEPSGEITGSITGTAGVASRADVPGGPPKAASARGKPKAEPQLSIKPRGGSDPSGLEELVRRALTWHPSVKETLERLNQQNEIVEQARAAYLPQVNWGVNSSYGRDTDESGYNPTVNLSASQMVYDFGKVNHKVEVERAGVEGRRSQVLLRVDELIRDAVLAFNEVQRNQALDKIARDQIRDTRSILELVRARTAKGASTRSDQLQAEARVQAAQAKELEIKAQMRRWQSRLDTLTGAPREGTPVSGAEPNWLNRACSIKNPNWSQIPAIMQADAERTAATAQVGLSKAEGLPTFSLEASVGADILELDDGDPEYNIGVNVKGSLYNGGENAARNRAANLALRASSEARDRVRVEVEGKLLEASGQIASYRQLLTSIASRETMMKQTRDLYRKQYLDLGTRTLLDLLNADQEFHAARFEAANIRYDLKELNADCAFQTGLLRRYLSLEGESLNGVRL
ncbi:TolC family outer membrane protein [Nitratireductor kimnyeongensis]|uniref:TolC family outer membrane protein n=1 Tax=Nitratireductor kimnyeongensis TaxID=430679 RepID=A0ABW0T4H0_9HYPH|nr:TolC family outer membrane protein [Nitratireductor kimnyeongensis]QZZ34762.1 TolC family outer membrane protein [Nitratireductor kimnyeongensis]